MARLVDWCRHASFKIWPKIEQSQCEVPLRRAVWCFGDLSSALKKHPTLGPTLRICSRICSTTLLSSVNSPLYPIVGNPRFPPGLQEGPFRKLSDSQCFQASHFIQIATGTWPSLPELTSSNDRFCLDFWSAAQLRHFLNTLPPPDRFQRTLTPLEQLCEGTGPCSHLISQMYALLVAPQEDYVPPYIRKWEMTLDRTFTQAQHRQIVNLALKSSISTRIQETNFKIMTRWYRTPSLLNKFFPEIPDKCWRCQEERGTLLHVLWSCPKLEYFWREIRRIAQKFTEYNLPEDPALFLLHVSNIPGETYSKLILRHLINAARSCIVRQWRDTYPPTILTWVTRIEEVNRMEDLLLSAQNRKETYLETWGQWNTFKFSEEGSSLFAPESI